MLDLRQFRALLALDEHGSVAAAARALDWSQPTVAHHLAGLERATGTPVVESRASGTSLTVAGRLWLPHAAAIVGRADRALVEVAATLEQARRTVRFGVFPTAAARLLPRLVAAFDAAGLVPEIVEAELDVLVSSLERLELDAAVVYTAPGAPAARGVRRTGSGVLRTPLFTEHFALVVPAGHPLAGAGGLASAAGAEPVHLADLAGERWVVGTLDDDPVDVAFRSAALRAGFDPLLGPRSDDYRVVVEYVAAGLGLAFVPELAVPVGRDDLAVVEVAGAPLTREVTLATAPSLDPELRELMVRALA
ncbi:LysR family transcriptional regulator [Agromyces sp. NPDC058136]|uniref:LysR family transcriptional regulator n=1 Tax=Agromyces sp. NPDC058136 TaxID=3346354 RepID=UPI0036DE18E9